MLEIYPLKTPKSLNYLIGNCDAHAKNFSVLHDVRKAGVKEQKLYAVKESGAITLAPFYDLASTDAFENLSKEMAMKIGGAWDIRAVQKQDFYKAAREISVKEKEIDELSGSFSSIVPAAQEIREEIAKAGFDAEICGRIINGMEKRLKIILP